MKKNFRPKNLEYLDTKLIKWFNNAQPNYMELLELIKT